VLKLLGAEVAVAVDRIGIVVESDRARVGVDRVTDGVTDGVTWASSGVAEVLLDVKSAAGAEHPMMDKNSDNIGK